MKLLVAVVIVQSALIAFLVAKTFDIDERQGAVAVTSTEGVAAKLSVDDVSDDAVAPGPVAVAAIDESRLREIIADELRNELDRQIGVRLVAGGSGTRSAAPPYSEETRRQREQVVQRIDYYRSAGTISEIEMLQLQKDIARLDEGGRQDMLNLLVQAMNAGEIDGNF